MLNTASSSLEIPCHSRKSRVMSGTNKTLRSKPQTKGLGTFALTVVFQSRMTSQTVDGNTKSESPARVTIGNYET